MQGYVTCLSFQKQMKGRTVIGGWVDTHVSACVQFSVHLLVIESMDADARTLILKIHDLV